MGKCKKSNTCISLVVMLVLTFLLNIKLKACEPQENLPLWHELDRGLYFREPDAPEKSFLNDSKIFILKIDPRLCKLGVFCSSEYEKKNRTADEWSKDFNLSVVVNAGMFNVANGITNKGYLKNNSHLNNSKFNAGYNVMMAMNPVSDQDPSMIIYDLTCSGWDSIRPKFKTWCQGMRMIDCNGTRMAWNKNPGQTCSMVTGATDISGNIYFIFSRSPYTHQKMIDFLISLIPGIRTTVYLEGGPEASLFIHTSDTTITKIGSYVSKTYANDNNDHFWKIPNVIGVVAK